MSIKLEDLAQWLEVTQSAVAVIGLPILTLTLLMIGRQAQYAHHTAMSQIYQNTADGFATVQRYFMDHPEYRPYFYDGKSIDAVDPEYVRVSAIAESFFTPCITSQYIAGTCRSIRGMFTPRAAKAWPTR